MASAVLEYPRFIGRCFINSFRGGPRFLLWMAALTILSLIGLNAYCKQLVHGLRVTGMSDQVSWGLYIANFTYLVGIAAAAVMLVIPAYIYKREEMHDVAIFGELLAIAAIVMCLLFVNVDLGRPERFWHMFPVVGRFNWPISILAWDVIVLMGYLALNAHICGYTLYMHYLGRRMSPWLHIPFVFIAMAWAISIHTVTAFLYVGLGGRAFWNSAILAPRFLASAFAGGPGLIVLTLQAIRRHGGYEVSDQVFFGLRRIIQVAMIINMFLLGCEVFKEFYPQSHHAAAMRYLYFGLHGHAALVPWIWTAVALNAISTVLLMLPASRGLKWLNVACLLAIAGIWVEKGMGLIVPGFIPTPLGEIVDYTPTTNEILVCVGVWAFGFLVYTILVKSAIPILTGRITARRNENEGAQP